LEATYPQIILVKQQQNKGFSATCNAGIKVATKELVFLMNSDILLTQNYFSLQFRYFSKPDTFGVFGKIIGYFDDKVQDTAKFPKLKWFKIKSCNNYEVKDRGADFMTPSFYLSGANALINRNKLRFIDGFDEIYSPFYSEDLDLSLRAWRMGWICYYEPNAVCRHEGSVTTNKLNKHWVFKIYQRNKYILHSVHLDGSSKLFYQIQITFDLLFRWVNLRFGAYTGFFTYLGMSKQINESRYRLATQMNQVQSQLSVADVIKKMKSLLSDKVLTKS
jgi:GT2 family glycosyltransferase